MKPGVLKGTRDFLPNQVLKRKYLFNTIEAAFQLYGYLPIETPAMEKLETLAGNYGEDGDRLLFKVLNNGDYLAKADAKDLANKNSKKITHSISKRAMRYDLTVPFTRYVVMHQNDIQFPFKRYQIQPVWRADRPQKGRYQEFYQCDVDVVGSKSLIYEAELVKMYDYVFRKLNLKVLIRINNRKILYGIAEYCGCTNLFDEFTVILDKIDKIGINGVTKELVNIGINENSVDKILECITIKPENCTTGDCIDCGYENSNKVIEQFGEKLGNEMCKVFCLKGKFTEENCSKGLLGIEELELVFKYLYLSYNIENDFEFSLSLARGLNYYTGCIFEVKALNAEMGSIGGGGRYDNLTEKFGGKNLSGIGISFGAERIFDVMEELELFNQIDISLNSKIIFLSMNQECQESAFLTCNYLRIKGVACEIYPEPLKMKKQMKYANERGFQYVGIVGEEERINSKIMLKDMISGEQKMVTGDELIEILK